ncbi:MAG: sulfatase [Planctomycetota bacterium]
MRGLLMLVVLVVVGCGSQSERATAAEVAVQPASGAQPNVLVLYIDDMAWADLGCYGNTWHETPAIDALAASGMRFTDAYAASAVCSPSRSAFQCGQYPARTHNTDWFGSKRRGPGGREPAPYEDRLPLETVTVAEAFTAAGYHTAYVGKWHLGPSIEFWPLAHGYELSCAANNWGMPATYFWPYRKGRSGRVLPDLDQGVAGEYLTDRLTDETIRYLHARADDGQPFLCMLAHYAVHTPIEAPAPLVEHYAAKSPPSTEAPWKNGWDPTYAAMVETVDQSVARIMAALDELGLREQTIVLLTSDNGGLARVTSNLPLRGGKGTYYEGGIRVPLMVSWPGRIAAGATSTLPTTGTDVMPTLLDLAGLPLQPQAHVDGETIASILTGGQQPELGQRSLFWHYPHFHGARGARPASVVRCGSYKLIEFLDDGSRELYDLASDRSETQDLASAQPERVAALQAQLDHWRSACGALPLPPQ